MEGLTHLPLTQLNPLLQSFFVLHAACPSKISSKREGATQAPRLQILPEPQFEFEEQTAAMIGGLGLHCLLESQKSPAALQSLFVSQAALIFATNSSLLS